MKVVVYFLFLHALIQQSRTCNLPLKIKSTSMRNCDSSKPNVIRMAENSSFYIDDQCNIISNICVEYDEFKTVSLNVISRSGTRVFYNKTFNPCPQKLDHIKKAMKIIAGFSTEETCTSRVGKFCNQNKKVSSINSGAMKIFEIIPIGSVKMQLSAQFDGGRTSCVMGEISIAPKL